MQIKILDRLRKLIDNYMSKNPHQATPEEGKDMDERRKKYQKWAKEGEKK